MKSIEHQALQADAKKTLTQMTRIMMDPAIPDHSWTMNDMDNVTKAIDALKSIKDPTNMVQRLMNERATAAVENGLFWAAQMLEREGFQVAKGAAWKDADQELAKATLGEYQRMTAHQRN